jgi:dynactin complex subunit
VSHPILDFFRTGEEKNISSSSTVGRWVGVALDEAKGKNNGTLKGTTYFTVSLLFASQHNLHRHSF